MPSPGRQYCIEYPLALESELDHQVIAARRTLEDSGVRRFGVRIKIDGVSRPRNDRRALPIVAVTLSYSSKITDIEVREHLRVAIERFEQRLQLSETEHITLTAAADEPHGEEAAES